MFVVLADQFCRLVSRLNKMQLCESRVKKVTKDRIFSLAVHPSEQTTLVVAGDKWGKIGFWTFVSRSKCHGNQNIVISITDYFCHIFCAAG